MEGRIRVNPGGRFHRACRTRISLGEVTGGGGHGDLDGNTIRVEVFGLDLRCLDLETLIHVKRAAGRPRDLEAIAELLVIREERGR